MAQVLFIISLLYRAVYNWISLFLINYLCNKMPNKRLSSKYKRETVTYFKSVAGFGEGINQVFGDIKEKRTAERGLENLR